jgi:hypothetical protein
LLIITESRGIFHPPTAGRLRLPDGRQVQDDIEKIMTAKDGGKILKEFRRHQIAIKLPSNPH